MSTKSAVSATATQNIPAGIGLALIGFFTFSANDALGKWLAATYPPGQILLLRSIFALVVLAPFAWRAGLRSIFVVERPWLHLLRIVFAVGETFLFYWAVSVLPLADAMTYYLAGPIYATLLAALFLGERVGWRRWLAVAVGFLGVLIALQPTAAAFGGYALIAFAGSVMYAVFLVITRSVRGTPDLTLAVWQIGGGLIAGIVTSPFTWVPIAHSSDFFLLGLLGVVALCAIVCINRALALAPASVIVPYQNTLLVWALVFGLVFFNDLPSWNLLTGAVIIVAACLYIFFREQQVTRGREPDIVSGP